jgi:hypothetical protein
MPARAGYVVFACCKFGPNARAPWPDPTKTSGRLCSALAQPTSPSLVGVCLMVSRTCTWAAGMQRRLSWCRWCVITCGLQCQFAQSLKPLAAFFHSGVGSLGAWSFLGLNPNWAPLPMGQGWPGCEGECRPRLVQLLHTQGVLVDTVTFQNSPDWTFHLLNWSAFCFISCTPCF